MEDSTTQATITSDDPINQTDPTDMGDAKWFYFSVLLILFIVLLQIMREMEKAKKSKLKKLKKMISANEQKEKLRQRDDELLKQIDEIKQ